jgi:tRNA1(Val) A37 N6-methylase TrmN6
MSFMRSRNLEPKRIRFVHSFQDKPASLILLEAVKSGGTGLEVLPPLIVHGPGGEYSKELIDIYGCAP